MKRVFSLIVLFLLLGAGLAAAESEVSMQYVCQNWAGKYTGQVDSTHTPFGFGVFISDTPRDGEMWHYIGAWEDGLPEGDGAIYFENGSMLKGKFRKGELIDGMKYSVSGISAVPVQAAAPDPADGEEAQFIGNKKSKRFHLPTCRAVGQMNEENRVNLSSREEAISGGYIPCGDCNP